MEKEINKVIFLSIDWKEKRKNNPTNYKIPNAAAKKLKTYIENLINNPWLLLNILLESVKREPIIFLDLAYYIKLFDENIIRQLYNKLNYINPEKYWEIAMVLKSWDSDIPRFKQENQEQIQKYQLWKKEHPEEAQRIIQELEDIIDSGMIE